MDTTTETTEIVDDGRQRERRVQLLDEYERSGLSHAAFARRKGRVKYPTFAHWVCMCVGGKRRQGRR
ncbi:MAG: hypothetical protein ABII82_02490 [Verrucomicrobiota bacterium]